MLHAWKSKLVKSDKTLLEIVKEEAQKISVLPLQIFFYERLYDVTWGRYQLFYRLKEAAVLATYDEAAECLDQLETLSGKEKACALFALTIFENKYRPRPQWLQDYLARESGPETFPYFPYHNIPKDNPLEIWAGEYEPDETIEPAFWQKWERAYQDAFKDRNHAFAAVDAGQQGGLSLIDGNYRETEYIKNWNEKTKRCLKNVGRYSGTFISSTAFLYGFNVTRLSESSPLSDIVKILKGLEEFESDDVDEIQEAYALREFLLLYSFKEKTGNIDPKELERDEKVSLYYQHYPTQCVVLGRPELGVEPSYEFTGNSSRYAKTVERIARELQPLRLCYDGSLLYPSEKRTEQYEQDTQRIKSAFDAWESKRVKPSQTLLEVVEEESKNVEVLPSLFCWHNVFYDMTFERYLPVYRIKEAAVQATYDEALECLEQLESLSGKEKACALFALTLFEIKRRPKYCMFGGYVDSEPEAPRFDYFPYRALDFSTNYQIWTGLPKPDFSIERSYWAKWNIAFDKALNDGDPAFAAIASSQENYAQPGELERSDNDELVSAWFDNVGVCAKLAQKYAGGVVSASDFLAPFPMDRFEPTFLPNAPTAKEIDPNSFGCRFLQGVENFNSDNAAETQEAFALREYWLRLHASRRPWARNLGSQYHGGSAASGMKSAVNSSYRAKTVGDVANELKKLRLEGEPDIM